MDEREDLIMQTDARVAVIELASGKQSPWHHHSQLTETVFCLLGSIDVETADPATAFELQIGERCQLAPFVVHRLVNHHRAPARYLLVQNGPYDFIDSDRGD
jgi:quercetin dioxygenase-like cupin family protein